MEDGGVAVTMEDKRQEEQLVEDILKHLDNETRSGVARMSVEIDETGEKTTGVSHKCCNM